MSAGLRVRACWCVFVLGLSVGCGDTPDPTDAGGGDDAGGGSDAGFDAAVDPCVGVTNCAAAGTTCDGAELVVCAADAMGCLVASRTDCAATGGFCDDSGATPACQMPPDPCDAIPAAERCDTAGTSCTDGTTLETCAPNAFGCLVRAATDCSARASGTCDPTVPAACAFTGDPCDGVTQCSTPGSATCDGPELVECRRDGFGCYVEVRTTCTDTMFGFCDEDATPRASCDTAASDPCMGMAECPTVGRTCDGDTLRVCATNAFGCDIEVATECAATSEVCDETLGPARCENPCALIDTCPGASFCDGVDAVTCVPDEHGCFVETGRTTCSGICLDESAGATCADDTLCPEAERTILDCSSGTISSTTVGGTTAFAGCEPGASYGGPERIFRFLHRGTDPVALTLTTSSTMTADHDLFVVAANFTDASCTSGVSCLARGTSGSTAENVTYVVAPGELLYLVYDDFGPLPGSPIDFDLTVSCATVICGDGMVMGEGCDDGNTADMDGCSSSCEVEPGYTCMGAPSRCRFTCGDGLRDPGEECDDSNNADMDGCSATCAIETGWGCAGSPSVCVMTAANGTCAGATGLTVPGTVMGDTRAGGPAPSGAACPLPPFEGGALYYSVPVAAGQRIAMEMTGTGFEGSLSIVDDCTALECTAVSAIAGPGAPATLGYLNSGATAETILVAAQPRFGGGSFTLTVSPVVCGDGVVAPGETCDDGPSPAGGDGCSATCQAELGWSCTGAPSTCTRQFTVTTIREACVAMTSGTDVMAIGDDVASPVAALPFAFTYFGDAVTHYSITSNGYLQLYTSATGMPSTSFNNTVLPNAMGPLGMVGALWDDLNVVMGTSTLRERVTGAAGSRRFIVEWGAWTPFGVMGDSLTFQIHLREGSNQIELHYCALSGGPRSTGSTATIGAQSADGMRGVTLSHDTAGAVMTGSAWRLTP